MESIISLTILVVVAQMRLDVAYVSEIRKCFKLFDFLIIYSIDCKFNCVL